MDTTILLYLICGVLLIILFWIFIIEIRLKRFFTGTNSRNLEEVLTLVGRKISNMEEVQTNTNEHLLKVDERLNKSIRSIKTIRFNPFTDAGSNQSFAIALMNDEKDGVIISSLYARDRMSIFAKPITNGKSEFELTDEEKNVLDKAVK